MIYIYAIFFIFTNPLRVYYYNVRLFYFIGQTLIQLICYNSILFCNIMENIKRIQVLIDTCTKEQQTVSQIPQSNLQNYSQIQELLKSRADMPKNFVGIVSKKLSFVNAKKLSTTYKTLDLIEFMVYKLGIQLYNHLSTKDFVYKLNAIMNHKDIVETQVYPKLMNLLHCLKELFSGYKDLLPTFFQFYQNLIEKGHIPNQAYMSHYRNEAKFQSAASIQENHQFSKKEEAFKQIRQKINLANDIISNTDSNVPIEENALLIEMYSDVQTHTAQLKELSDSLNYLISSHAKALMTDVENTKIRFEQLKSGKKPSDFVACQVKKEQEMVKVEQKAVENQAGKLVKQEKIEQKALGQSNKSNVKKTFMNILGFEPEIKNKSKKSIPDENDFKTEFHCL